MKINQKFSSTKALLIFSTYFIIKNISMGITGGFSTNRQALTAGILTVSMVLITIFAYKKEKLKF
jgi:hypothetical protein